MYICVCIMIIGIVFIGIKKWNSRLSIEPILQLNNMSIFNLSNQISNTAARYQTEDKENFDIQIISRSINVQQAISELETISGIKQLPNASMLICMMIFLLICDR